MQEIKQYIDYIKFEKRFSNHTIQSYSRDLNQFEKFISQKFDIGILQCDYNHIRSWIIFLSNESLTKRTINRKISSLRSFFKYHLIIGKLVKNPVAQIDLLKTPKTLPVFVEEESMEHLFRDELFDNDFKGVLSKAIVETLYGTGIRVAELVGLESHNIDWVKSQIKVLGKRNKERVIPISENLLESLHIYNKVKNEYFDELDKSFDDRYFFITDKGKKIYSKFVYRIINYYLSLVTTIKKKSPHVIRHTFATHMLNRGADLNAIKEILGHTSLSATQIYTHNSIEKLKHVYKQAHPKA